MGFMDISVFLYLLTFFFLFHQEPFVIIWGACFGFRFRTLWMVGGVGSCCAVPVHALLFVRRATRVEQVVWSVVFFLEGRDLILGF